MTAFEVQEYFVSLECKFVELTREDGSKWIRQWGVPMDTPIIRVGDLTHTTPEGYMVPDNYLPQNVRPKLVEDTRREALASTEKRFAQSIDIKFETEGGDHFSAEDNNGSPLIAVKLTYVLQVDIGDTLPVGPSGRA